MSTGIHHAVYNDKLPIQCSQITILSFQIAFIGATGQSDNMDESLLQIGSLKLRVYQGDITHAQTDVIVNTTNSDFELTRGWYLISYR